MTGDKMRGVTTQKTSEGEPELKILYIEDEPDILEPLLAYIRRKYGSSSVGARSVDTARKLLKDAPKPHFAIHDCHILFSDVDRVDSPAAGDELYVELVMQEIPVVVLSGSNAGFEEEPYVSHPPQLGFISKPADEEKIDEAVRRFRECSKRHQP